MIGNLLMPIYMYFLQYSDHLYFLINYIFIVTRTDSILAALHFLLEITSLISYPFVCCMSHVADGQAKPKEGGILGKKVV